MLRYFLHVWKGFVVSVVVMIVFGSSAQGFELRTGEGLSASQDAPEFGGTGGDTLLVVDDGTGFEMDSFRQIAPQLDVTEMAVSTDKKGSYLEFRGGDLTGVESLMAFPVTTSRTVRLSASVRESAGGSGTIDFTFALEEPPMVSELLPGCVKRLRSVMCGSTSPLRSLSYPNQPLCCSWTRGCWGSSWGCDGGNGDREQVQRGINHVAYSSRLRTGLRDNRGLCVASENACDTL